jgi:hypothetical protein
VERYLLLHEKGQKEAPRPVEAPTKVLTPAGQPTRRREPVTCPSCHGHGAISGSPWCDTCSGRGWLNLDAKRVEGGAGDERVLVTVRTGAGEVFGALVRSFDALGKALADPASKLLASFADAIHGRAQEVKPPEPHDGAPPTCIPLTVLTPVGREPSYVSRERTACRSEACVIAHGCRVCGADVGEPCDPGLHG